MQERRRSARIQIVQFGKMEFYDSSIERPCVENCIIRNISEHGAGLYCGQDIAAPKVFNLAIEKTAERRVAYTVWCNAGYVGVAFASNVTVFPGTPQR